MISKETDTNDMDIPEELPYSEESVSQISIPIEVPPEPAPKVEAADDRQDALSKAQSSVTLTMNVSSSLHMGDDGCGIETVPAAQMGARKGQLHGQKPVDCK